MRCEINQWKVRPTDACPSVLSAEVMQTFFVDESLRTKTLKREAGKMLLASFFIIKPTRLSNFSNLLLEWNSTCFEQFLCPSSGVFHCTHSSGICHTGLLTVCKRDQSWSWSLLQAVSIKNNCGKQCKTPDDGQGNCPKHVEFHSKNKFEKLVHLVGFITSNLTQCTVTWTSNAIGVYCLMGRCETVYININYNLIWVHFLEYLSHPAD
jgi:hypothetical protein